MDIVRHYENKNLYVVISREGTDVDTKTPCVIYKSLIENKWYKRSPEIFDSEVNFEHICTVNGYRLGIYIKSESKMIIFNLYNSEIDSGECDYTLVADSWDDVKPP